MAFQSILFDPDIADDGAAEPDCFGDLHLDQIAAALTAGREHYRLRPFLHQALHDVEAVLYRQHVLRDLEQDEVMAAVRSFADEMERMHDCLAQMEKLHHARQQQWWFLARAPHRLSPVDRVHLAGRRYRRALRRPRCGLLHRSHQGQPCPEYCARHVDFVDDTVARFDREVQFYLAYLEHIAPLKQRGLRFSYPRVSARSKQEHVTAAFDLALATKLRADGSSVVCNDFDLSGAERILVVSGPRSSPSAPCACS